MYDIWMRILVPPRGCHVAIQVNAPGKRVHSHSKAGILGIEGHLAQIHAYLITVVIAGKIE